MNERNGRGVIGWLVAAWLLLAGAGLALLAGAAQAVQSFVPLRNYVATLGTEFVLGTVGDSWTCNAQIDGETQDWGGTDGVGGSAPNLKNLIWADPTTTHGATWTNRLAWRLKTHKHVTEAVGGAYLSTTGTTFAYAPDSSICGWVDNLAAYPCKVVVGYGGINNMMSTTVPAWNSLKPGALGFAKLMLDQFPPTVPIIIPTLQPCSLRPMHYKKKSGTNAWTGLTWTQVGDNALAIQARQQQFNGYLKDTLKVDLYAAGYDTSRVYIYDHYEKLAYQSTWTAGAAAALYPLTLGNGTTGLPSATQADSVKWAALRFLRPEIESDSIHANHKGLRQIGDSMAVNVFGINLGTWTAGTAKTLYVSKQAGDNWDNRTLETSSATPLATLQAAIFRAWPGDSIAVVGVGNQALIKSGYSVAGSELRFTKPSLRIGFASTAYYDGEYNVATGVGVGWFDYDNSTGGDNKELPPSIKVWPTTAVHPTNYPRVDLDLRISGLRTRGYQSGIRLKNVSGVTLTDCILKGGSSGNGSLSVLSFGDTLTWNLNRCTFYCDSNTVTSAAGATGSVFFTVPTNATGDTCRFVGTIKQCEFNGLAAVSSAPAVYGYVDGMDFVANTFTDPTPYQYGWINPSRTAGVTGDIKFIHNKFSMTATTEIRMVYSSETTNADIDSLVLIGNLIYAPGATLHANTTLYRGPYTAARAWVDGNVVSSAASAIFAQGSATSLATLVSNGAASASRNWPVHVSLTGDTLIFGARAKSLFHGAAGAWYGLEAYGIDTAPIHASIGPTQYTGDPIVWSGNYPGRQSYQDMPPWKLLSLINAGVLPAVTATNVATYYEIPRVYDESSLTMVETWLDAWRLWPAATRAKIQYRFGDTSCLIKSADSTYVGPAQLMAALTNGDEVACDSTDASTWFIFTRPYNRTDKLQLQHWMDYMEVQADADRKKFRFRVADTDLGMYSPATDTSYPNGLWELYAAIGAGEVASDSTVADNWFCLPRERPNAYAQGVQNRIYTRALAVWPEAKRKQVRVRTK